MHANVQSFPTHSEPRFKGTMKSPRPPSVSLVLPAWNECEAIPRAIVEADAALRELVDDYEIIIVDDGSSDGTAAAVRGLAESLPSVRLVRHQENRGYGAALRTGFQTATKDLVVFTDSDSQFDLTELDRFVLLSERSDIVCGYRIDRKDTPLRCFYSRVYNQLVRLLLPIDVRDVDCAFKMFHREVARKLQITTDGFLVNSELLTEARRKNYTVIEVGVSHRPRTQGQSTVSVTHIPKVLTDLLRYWWNRVQFPSSAAQTPLTSNPPLSRGPRWGWLQCVLLIVAAAFLFSNLDYPLIDRDETRYAEIPREMLVSGNWVLPQLNFEPYYDKPPLVYWLCAMSYVICGVSEWSARLVPAFAALATLTATMSFGSRMFDRKTGLISGVVLLLSAGFTFTGRYLLIDGVLSLLVTLSLFTAFESVRGPKLRLGWWVLSAIFCGLGFLTKGPISLVLLMPPIFAFGWLAESFPRPRWWHFATTLGIVTLVAAPWLSAVSAMDPSFLSEFFYRHNLKRFAGEFHAKPFWFFLPVLLIAGHPWSFLTISLTRFMFSRDSKLQIQRPPALGFLMLWSGWCFLFFSLSSCKLPTYILPAAPALALFVAHYLNQVIQARGAVSTAWFAPVVSARTATATTALAGLGFLAYAAVLNIETSLAFYGWFLFWLVLLAATVAGSLQVFSEARKLECAWASTTAAAFLLAIMVMHGILPAYSRKETIFGTASPLARQLDLTPESPIATIAHEFSEVPFYLRRADIPNWSVNGSRSFEEFIAEHRQATLIVDRQTSDATVLDKLPIGSKIHWLAERGPARILRAVTPPPTPRLTENHAHTSIKK